MNDKLKSVIKEYQCSGCMDGNFDQCYRESPYDGVGCGKHMAGTGIPFIGKIYLGLPKGFNRLGMFEKMIPVIYEEFGGHHYDKFNIPVWKRLDELGNTLVRGIKPRLNEPFLHIYIGNHVTKIDCFLITEKDIEEMD